MNPKASLVCHAVAGWALCGATVAVGRQLVSLRTTLRVHAVVAPVVFGLLTRRYARNVPGAAPAATAVALTGIVVALDAVVVAPLVERSFAMFRSAIGTWVPFGSILAASYLVGRTTSRRSAWRR